mgnify:CR=1 FL=1
MVFRNINNNQVAYIESESLIAQYKNDKEWVEADKTFMDILAEKKRLEEQKEIEFCKMSHIKSKLVSLSEDIIQDVAGVEVVNISEKKQTFFKLLNELRSLENKEPKGLKQN